jgi:hypothetical protein
MSEHSAELDRRGVPRFSVADMTPEQRDRLRAVGVNLPPESSYTDDLPPGDYCPSCGWVEGHDVGCGRILPPGSGRTEGAGS